MDEIKETQETVTRYMEYRFALAEMTDISQEMARAVGVRSDAELRLKEVSAQIKSEIAAQDTIVIGCASKLRQGYEFRNIKCTVLRDFERGTYRVLRNDTGEVIEDRLLRENELQLAMAE